MEPAALWLHLMRRLDHMLLELERPAADRLFKAQGTRRIGLAQRQLRRERDELSRIGDRWGLVLVPRDEVAGMPVPAPMDDLEDDYVKLVEDYRVAAEIASGRGDRPTAEWFQVRARIHALQHFLLRPLGGTPVSRCDCAD